MGLNCDLGSDGQRAIWPLILVFVTQAQSIHAELPTVLQQAPDSGPLGCPEERVTLTELQASLCFVRDTSEKK